MPKILEFLDDLSLISAFYPTQSLLRHESDNKNDVNERSNYLWDILYDRFMIRKHHQPFLLINVKYNSKDKINYFISDYVSKDYISKKGGDVFDLQTRKDYEEDFIAFVRDKDDKYDDKYYVCYCEKGAVDNSQNKNMFVVKSENIKNEKDILWVKKFFTDKKYTEKFKKKICVNISGSNRDVFKNKYETNEVEKILKSLEIETKDRWLGEIKLFDVADYDFKNDIIIKSILNSRGEFEKQNKNKHDEKNINQTYIYPTMLIKCDNGENIKIYFSYIKNNTRKYKNNDQKIEKINLNENKPETEKTSLTDEKIIKKTNQKIKLAIS